MTYDPHSDETTYPAVRASHCEGMRDRYNWQLKEVRRKNRDIMPVDCVFEGDVEFPKWFMDWSKGTDK